MARVVPRETDVTPAATNRSDEFTTFAVVEIILFGGVEA